MKTLSSYTLSSELSTSIPVSRRSAVFGIMAAALSLHGCGGGGGDSAGNTITGATGTLSSGIITGLGSIIVNGIRFDDSLASISDDDDGNLSSNDLKIGMVVSVRGSSVRNVNGRNSATANSISTNSEIKGPVDSVGASSFVVLGQTINVNANTVYAPSLTGLAALRAGDLVEIHGFTDVQTNSVMASLIERKTNLNQYRLTGKVTALDTTARTFSVGSLQINYASADVRVTLANNTVVRVRLSPTPATGIRTALRIQSPELTPSVRDNFESSELHGTITAFTSINRFSVNGIQVITNANTFYPKGTASITLGARVEVKGSLIDGVLNAQRVKPEDINEVEALENELIGVISALNTASKTFVVRGVTVDYSSTSVSYINGTVNNLANGRVVEVSGRMNAANAVLSATRIQFES
jgi:Domain of unknown function (DUF5666)